MTTSPSPLVDSIRQTLTKSPSQSIPFDQFMAMALYDPDHGYYNRAEMDIGATGDFTTASELSPLFAQCFASTYQQIAKHIDGAAILELGAGTGHFAINLLSSLEKANNLPTHYYIYEISASLRKKQKTVVEKHIPHLSSRISWLSTLPGAFKGLVIANEVLDALPVNLFTLLNNQILERSVTWHNNALHWCYRAPSKKLYQEVKRIQESHQLPNDYHSEINLQIPIFLETLLQSIAQGVILFSDYGYGEKEYYHPERRKGTLTCFYQHQKSDEPLLRPGQQDMTAHVNFTSVIEAATDFGGSLAGFTTQAAFLLANDLVSLAEIYEAHLDEVERYKHHQAIKRLTLPQEVGERIKIMAISKNTLTPLKGLELSDRRREL